jgi:Mg-chelatase subunit ChlD
LGREAAEIYLGDLGPIIEALRKLHLLEKKLEKEQAKGGSELSEALKVGYEATLKVV